jgi:putative phosphoesterase
VVLAIIADTHMPRGQRRLPDACIEQLRAAELVVHAGDLAQLSVLRELEALGEVLAVHGNVDDAELRSLLPERRQFHVDGVRIGLIHDAGPARGRLERLHDQFPGADAVIFGHSHLPLLEQAADGFQIFNPGSPTERRRAPHRTMGVARTAAGSISFELVELG